MIDSSLNRLNNTLEQINSDYYDIETLSRGRFIDISIKLRDSDSWALSVVKDSIIEIFTFLDKEYSIRKEDSYDVLLNFNFINIRIGEEAKIKEIMKKIMMRGSSFGIGLSVCRNEFNLL